MSRILIASIICLLFIAAPLYTRAADSDLKTGFSLGRYSTTAMHIAMELTYMQSLIDSAHPADITDEALAAGKVTEQEASLAQHAAAYVIWRIQFYIDPMLESAHSTDSFSNPALADLKQPTQTLMDDLKTACDAYLGGPDSSDPTLAGLAVFSEALKQGDYANKLAVLAEQAAQKAGVDIME